MASSNGGPATSDRGGGGEEVTETMGDHVSGFYLKLYHHALRSPANVDHQILQLRSAAATADAEGAQKIHGELDDAETMLSTTLLQDGHGAIESHKTQIQKRQKHFYEKLLAQDSLMQMQEERRIRAEFEIKVHQTSTRAKKVQAEELLQEGIKVHRDTLHTKQTVESYKAYKEYVGRSVPLWGREAATVDAVCGRFRDLLNLRFQLMSQVESEFKQLQNLRELHQQIVKSEKIREGRALLEVYRCRTARWEADKRTEASKNQLRNLRNASTGIATRLTRVRLALANMYSVARRFQSSLQPLQPNTASTDILKRLHNFLLDASRVANIAKFEHSCDSLKAEKQSAVQKI